VNAGREKVRQHHDRFGPGFDAQFPATTDTRLGEFEVRDLDVVVPARRGDGFGNVNEVRIRLGPARAVGDQEQDGFHRATPANPFVRIS